MSVLTLLCGSRSSTSCVASAYVSIRQHTSAYVSMRQNALLLVWRRSRSSKLYALVWLSKLFFERSLRHKFPPVAFLGHV